MPARPGLLTALLVAAVAAGCSTPIEPDGEVERTEATDDVEPGGASSAGVDRTPAPTGSVTLAFAGDVHFEGALAALPGRPRTTLGPMSAELRSADVAMVNLESALGTGGRRAAKENEDASARYWFRSPPAALDLLDRSGVDVVSIANNHGADYGVAGLRESLRIAEDSPVAVVGAGRDVAEAFTPYRTEVRGIGVSVLAADASPRESADPVWAVGPGTGPGLATARTSDLRPVVAAVRAADALGDVVVVYLHWGEEQESCPTTGQRQIARALADAGADVVVGTHAHVLQGAGLLGETSVAYGLGNFFWYHGARSETGVLRLTVDADGTTVAHDWVPARIAAEGGAPRPLAGAARATAQAQWSRLRACADLAPPPGPAAPAPDPEPRRMPFTSTVSRIGPAMARRMATTHDPATCPVPLADLRHLSLTHVGFDGGSYQGRMIVHADVAADVVEVFAALHRARFPIERMRLVDAYGGDDDRSMAANNTSGYNCRTVAGQSTFSDHAYGRAVDINPVQNPYVLEGGDVLPPSGRRFVAVDRSPGARLGRGVIGEDDVVTRTFDRLGWTWGGAWRSPDFQHFSRPDR
ncbi:CapA family protein [Nocardioides sp. C4-1]|uniref:CapA family protein n=1 Tax=Nocardioides sp. C4-1 TaxID=3151851 RepID=UPI0032668715